MWTEPKTTWRETDFFNIEDYNRIKNNISHVMSVAMQLWPQLHEVPMGPDKTYDDISFYADEINAMEQNVEVFADVIFRLPGKMKIFYENTPFIDYIELNRLETDVGRYYALVQNRLNSRTKLAFRLGGGKF